MSMIEVSIRIGEKKYTRDEALALYEELAAFLGKPTVKTVIERAVERERPYPPYVYPAPRWEMPEVTKTSPWIISPTMQYVTDPGAH